MVVTPEQLAKSGSEAAHQKALFCWAAINVNKYPELKWLFHIPNGGSRDIREATNLKAQGVKPGVPDIFLPIAYTPSNGGKWFHGLFIELKKVGGGVVSDEQNEWLAFLRGQGYSASVCHGWEQARDCIIRYLGVR